MANIREKAARKLRELREKALDKETQRKVREEIQKRFHQAKDQLKKLEVEFRKPENRMKAKEQVRLAKARLAMLKKQFLRKERMARAYTQRNPEKALAVAAAAGALVGAVWVGIRRHK